MGRTSDTPLHTALRTPEFWRCYALDGTDGFDVDATGERLAEEIGEPNLDLPVRPDWFLRLSLCFEVNLHTLYLCDLDPDEDYEDYEDDDEDVPVDSQLELGHWDQARWHPFCLRWEELEAVVRRMRAEPDRQQVSPEQAMLLLARWVGHGADEQDLLVARRRSVAGALERPGLFHGDDAARMAAGLLVAVSEDDYAWRWDAEKGWTFGGDYGCYSNRNDGHDFPFAEFAEFRQMLGVADEPASVR
ncbi:hypothetical protein [Actinoplanes sp. NPDC049118]|uniref:hypothetical protein n=1 Tax=Actinoplanes sp. NPDC049118 TaxID=3155769 RepID=UPI0033FF3BF3